jgi:hypothetical protein
MFRGKKLLHAAAAIGALAVIVTAAAAQPTFAAKGGRNAASVPSSIALDQSAAWLGETVTFTTSIQGIKGSEWPMIGVACSQSGAVTYGELNTPSSSFLLGGGSSVWLTNGGAADCVATLYAYGWSGGTETIRTLASTPFFAAASAP